MWMNYLDKRQQAEISGCWRLVGDQRELGDTQCQRQRQLTRVTLCDDTWRQCQWRPTVALGLTVTVSDILSTADNLPLSYSSNNDKSSFQVLPKLVLLNLYHSKHWFFTAWQLILHPQHVSFSALTLLVWSSGL